MLSKESRAATCALVVGVFFSACSLRAPWQNERRNEVNVGFSLTNNVVIIAAALDGQQRQFIVATGTPRSILTGAGPAAPSTVTLGSRARIVITPERLGLAGIADGLLGTDAWEKRALTLDYTKKLLTLDLLQQQRTDSQPFTFTDLPTVPITVDGRSFDAVIDSSSPDTLIIPGQGRRRAKGKVTVGRDVWGTVDYQIAEVSAARIGNRLLSKYLLTIDYRTKQSYLWKVSTR